MFSMKQNNCTNITVVFIPWHEIDIKLLQDTFQSKFHRRQKYKTRIVLQTVEAN